jgi:hypothetical protein
MKITSLAYSFNITFKLTQNLLLFSKKKNCVSSDLDFLANIIEYNLDSKLTK